MKDTNGSEDWRVLCELASKEKDPEKLIDLIAKINQTLEECHQKPRHHVDANAYSYGVSPQLSQAADTIVKGYLIKTREGASKKVV